MRRVAIILLLLGGIYVGLAAAFYLLMCQSPVVFAKTISKLPAPVFFLPFERLWSLARKGNLEVGEEAPDFELHTVDRQARVRLSSFRGQKPVVLVFGSYT